MSAQAGTVQVDARDRAAVAEERFTVPVILAALASVPAMFLTMLEGPLATVGTGINYASLAVFTAETLVLFALAGDRLRWLREHRFMVLVAVAAIPAVLFAAGGVQALRLLRFVRVVGALRIIRVGRILKAARILRRRAGLTGRAWQAAATLFGLLSAAFVWLVLADPTSHSRRFLDATLERFGFAPVILAGLVLAGATFVVARQRRLDRDEHHAR